jgi:uncharacterized protein (TIGR00269 family)
MVAFVPPRLVLCSKCHQNESVFYRKYSGEELCKKCFLRSIEDKTARTISKYSMICRADRIAVAVSGGKDSLSLLYVLKKFADEHDSGNQELVAITIDEGIKGYRDESLLIAREFCARFGIESKTVSYKSLFGLDMDEAMILRPSEKLTSCSMCGTFRRRAIDIVAESVGANVIATAHNIDDQLQSFMINLLAGDVERIGWIYPEPVEYSNGMRKVKPFIEIYENEIAFYALQHEIPFQSEECPYMDESIRTDLREFFNRLERDRPGIKYNAYSSMMKVARTLRGSSVSIGYKKCELCGRDSSGGICSVCKTTGLLTSNKQI